MTIPATNRNDALGNDSTDTYEYGFKIFAATHLEVKVKRASDGSVTTLTYPTHYSVTNVGKANGGNVVLESVGGAWQNSDGTLKTGYSISILRSVPLAQGTDIRNQGDFFASVHEDAFDYQMMVNQYQADAIERSVRLDSAYDPDSFDMTLPAPSAGLAIGWNATEDGLANLADLGGVGTTPFTETLLDDANADAFWQTLQAGIVDWDLLLQDVFDGVTAETAPAVGDLILISDVSLTPDDGRKMTLSDMLKVINGLTEDTAPDATADFSLVYDASAGAPKKVALRNHPFMPKHISGLTYSNNGVDATNDIDIAPGSARDATDAVNMVLASSITKQSDAAWAVGSNAGGLDTGAVGNNDYYIWLIKRSDTGVVDVLFSLSSTAPTMPTGYDYKRLIGWFKRSGGAILAFKTYETEGGGIEFAWVTPREDVNLANTLTNSRRTDALSVPLGFSTIARVAANAVDASNGFARIMNPDEADIAVSSDNANVPVLPVSNGRGSQVIVRTSSAGLVASRSNIATVDTYIVETDSFTWARR